MAASQHFSHSPGGAAAASARVAGRWLFVLCLCVYLFSAGGSLTTSDAVATYELTRSLVERGAVDISPEILGKESYKGPDGRAYSPFGLGQSLWAVPFYVGGTAAARVSGLAVGKPDTVPKAVVALSQTFLGAWIVWQTFHLALMLTGQLRASVFAALTLAFASLLWPYAQFGFNQPLACGMLFAALRLAISGKGSGRLRTLFLSGAALGLGLLTRHELMLAVVPLVMFLAWDGHGLKVSRRLAEQLSVFLAPVLACVAVWLVYNAVRFGSPFDSGHVRDVTHGFWSPIGIGLAGLLFSPDASVVVYSPFAVAGFIGLLLLVRRNPGVGLLFVGVWALFTLFYATLDNWIGGRSYGGRYLVLTLPHLAVGWAVLLATLRPRPQLIAALFVGGVGLLVQLPGVLVDYSKVRASMVDLLMLPDEPGGGVETTLPRWAAAPLVLNTRALRDVAPANFRYVTGRETPPQITPADVDDRAFSSQFAFSLDLWWLYLYYVDALSRRAVLLIVTAFTFVSAVAVWRIGVNLRTAGRDLAYP